jgi:hypothetical protein
MRPIRESSEAVLATLQILLYAKKIDTSLTATADLYTAMLNLRRALDGLSRYMDIEAGPPILYDHKESPDS